MKLLRFITCIIEVTLDLIFNYDFLNCFKHYKYLEVSKRWKSSTIKSHNKAINEGLSFKDTRGIEIAKNYLDTLFIVSLFSIQA